MYDTIKSLIGSHVTAIGSCGMHKGEEVFGILSNQNNDWIVTIVQEDGWEVLCSVYYNSIRKV